VSGELGVQKKAPTRDVRPLRPYYCTERLKKGKWEGMKGWVERWEQGRNGSEKRTKKNRTQWKTPFVKNGSNSVSRPCWAEKWGDEVGKEGPGAFKGTVTREH